MKAARIVAPHYSNDAAAPTNFCRRIIGIGGVKVLRRYAAGNTAEAAWLAALCLVGFPINMTSTLLFS